MTKTIKSNEKSKWFHSDFKNDTVAVVLIAPGLNLLPSKMDSLAKFFASKKCDVLRISLGANPEHWTEKFSDSYDAALEHAEIMQRPLYFLGFSLGALVGIHYIARHPYQQFIKCALIAPATHTRAYTIIPALLAKIFPKGSLPSLNLEKYRERSRTTLAEYKKMRTLQNDIKITLKNNDMNIATLLITNPQDELVKSSDLVKFAGSNPMWNTLELTNKGSLLSKKYHHLIIDSDSIGAEEWEKLLQSLSNHFAL
ncbi:MAG: alpha/beta hydrolase [Bacteriovorax sp.]|nr:alpha/beta hydrolase [Bacteriovorax sp.]